MKQSQLKMSIKATCISNSFRTAFPDKRGGLKVYLESVGALRDIHKPCGRPTTPPLSPPLVAIAILQI